MDPMSFGKYVSIYKIFCSFFLNPLAFFLLLLFPIMLSYSTILNQSLNDDIFVVCNRLYL